MMANSRRAKPIKPKPIKPGQRHHGSATGQRAVALVTLAGLMFLSACATVRETNRPKHWQTSSANSPKDIEGVYHSLCQYQDGKRSSFKHLDDELGEYFDLSNKDSRYFRINAIGDQQITLEFFDAGGSPVTSLLFDISDDGNRIFATPVGIRMQSAVHLNKLRLTTTSSGDLTVFLDIEYRHFLETRGFEHYLRCESIQRQN